MHVKPVRYQDQGCLHFITFSCYRRMPLLDSLAAKETFEAELERVRAWYGCYITGCSDARTRAPADQRTRTLEIVCGDTDAQADHVTKAARETSPALLAGPLLRFSRMERSETHREAAVHPSQSGKARTGGEARGLEMEQLCSLWVGTEGIVEIESQWTARRREQMGVVLVARAHPPAKNAGRVGQPHEGD